MTSHLSSGSPYSYVELPVVDKWSLSWNIHSSFDSHKGTTKMIIPIIFLYIHMCTYAQGTYISLISYTLIFRCYWLERWSVNILAGTLPHRTWAHQQHHQIHQRNHLVCSFKAKTTIIWENKHSHDLSLWT
jgi:hypothetical protein